MGARGNPQKTHVEAHAVTEQQASIFDVEPPPPKPEPAAQTPPPLSVSHTAPSWSASLEQYLAGW